MTQATAGAAPETVAAPSRFRLLAAIAFTLVIWASGFAGIRGATAPASRAASLLYLVPPIAFAIAWAWLGERPSALSLLGGIPIVAGIALVNRSRS